MDSKGLEAAYSSFLDLAASGPFVAPGTPQKWTAELIVAHMIVIDHLLAAAITELLAGETPRYDNRPAIREVHLRAFVAAAGDWSGLLTAARLSSNVVCSLVREIDQAAASRPIPVLLQSGEQIVCDSTMAFADLLDAQTKLHLPGHAQQLQALKA